MSAMREVFKTRKGSSTHELSTTLFPGEGQHGDNNRGHATKDGGFRVVPSLDEEPHITNAHWEWRNQFNTKWSTQDTLHMHKVKWTQYVIYMHIYFYMHVYIYLCIYIPVYKHNNHIFYAIKFWWGPRNQGHEAVFQVGRQPCTWLLCVISSLGNN